MPVWHELTQPWREEDELVVVGIATEQHPDRMRLYAQWKELGWPILWDPFNLTGSDVVPNRVFVDEHGIVRFTGLDAEAFEVDFMLEEFAAPDVAAPPLREPAKHLIALDEAAESSFEHAHLRALSDLLWGVDDARDDAVEILELQAEERPDDPRYAFRAGVARRLRYDSEGARPEDFQAALDLWTRALSLRPSQYVWRRRIQQYGPRMDKPFPFYSWVVEARTAVAARGETPVELRAALTPAELAVPQTALGHDPAAEGPDPGAEIPRDEVGLVAIESAVAFDTQEDRPVASVHLALRPNAAKEARWDPEAGPLSVWVDAPEGWRLDRSLLEERPAAAADGAHGLVLEVSLPEGVQGGELSAYALYYVCEGVDGRCLYLRQDFTVPVRRP